MPKIEIVKIFLPLIIASLFSLNAPLHNQVNGLNLAAEFLAVGDDHGAALQIARVACLIPWRSDLWEYAGELLLQTGDAQKTIKVLSLAERFGSLKPEASLLLGDALEQTGNLRAAIEVWSSIHIGEKVSYEIDLRLASAYQRMGNLEQASVHLLALQASQPADPLLNYRLGIILAAIDPEASLAYLSIAGESDPAYLEVTENFRREIHSARRSPDQSFLYLSSGRVLASLGEWVAANEAFQRAVNTNPTYAEAWAYLGEAAQHLNRDGHPQLELARKLDPSSIAANTFLAIYWQREGRYDLATLYLQVAEEVDPKNPVIQVELGRILALAGKLQKAEAHYQKAVQLASRDPQYWNELADFSIAYDYQVRTLGLNAARQALLLNPDDAASLDVMAQVLSILGDPLSALRFLDRAIRIDAAYAPAHLHLGVIYLLRGESQKAYRQLSLAKELAKPESATAEHARRLLAQITP